MNLDFTKHGSDWIAQIMQEILVEVNHVLPSEFVEKYRYLPSSVTSRPGYYRFSVTPYMREIVDCFDIHSPVREINLQKGVQIAATTGMVESVLLYFMAHVKTLPIGYVTADKELAEARVENNIIPMLNQSGFENIIRSSDIKNPRKTGKTKNHLQWGEDGYLIPQGAKNAAKQRQFSFCIMLKDELDGWPAVGKDGNTDAVTDDRTKGYEQQRKIGRLSTPSLHPSMIEAAYLRGDQRKYYVKCLACEHPQELRWSGTNDRGQEYGIIWEYNEHGQVDEESVCYVCCECGHPHYEHDKTLLFDPEEGAEWVPTAVPVHPSIRSYHLSALYSPVGMGSWYWCVTKYLKGWDPKTNKVVDVGHYQTFYNNVLGKPFKMYGSKVTQVQVKGQVRDGYHYGEIQNSLVEKYTGGKILFLTCAVDVHKKFLAVSVVGWTRDGRSFLVDYWKYEDKSERGCADPDSPVWERLKDLVVKKRYHSNEGDEYHITLSFVDAGWEPDTVSTFCAKFESGVFPIVGRRRPANASALKTHTTLKLDSGCRGFTIYVDGYKDRLAGALRRVWTFEEHGAQPVNHVNFPLDITTKQLNELTVETKEKEIDKYGKASYFWFRPSGTRNELWDLMAYNMATVDILAADMCVAQAELPEVDMDFFWSQFE